MRQRGGWIYIVEHIQEGFNNIVLFKAPIVCAPYKNETEMKTKIWFNK